MQAKGGLGRFFVDFTPIHDDWLSWKTYSGELEIIHERCFHIIAIDNKEALRYLGSKGVCAKCGVEAPRDLQQFILLANGVRGYEASTK